MIEEDFLDSQEQLTVAWRVATIAEVSISSGRLQVDYLEDVNLPEAYGGVYVWYVTYEKPNGQSWVQAAYIGESQNLQRRIGNYLSAGISENNTEGRLVKHISDCLDAVQGSNSTGSSARLGFVYDVWFDGSRPWAPAQKADRLAVEAAMVVHGATVRGIQMGNQAAVVRALPSDPLDD